MRLLINPNMIIFTFFTFLSVVPNVTLALSKFGLESFRPGPNDSTQGLDSMRDKYTNVYKDGYSIPYKKSQGPSETLKTQIDNVTVAITNSNDINNLKLSDNNNNMDLVLPEKEVTPPDLGTGTPNVGILDLSTRKWLKKNMIPFEQAIGSLGINPFFGFYAEVSGPNCAKFPNGNSQQNLNNVVGGINYSPRSSFRGGVQRQTSGQMSPPRFGSQEEVRNNCMTPSPPRSPRFVYQPSTSTRKGNITPPNCNNNFIGRQMSGASLNTGLDIKDDKYLKENCSLKIDSTLPSHADIFQRPGSPSGLRSPGPGLRSPGATYINNQNDIDSDPSGGPGGFFLDQDRLQALESMFALENLFIQITLPGSTGGGPGGPSGANTPTMGAAFQRQVSTGSNGGGGQTGGPSNSNPNSNIIINPNSQNSNTNAVTAPVTNQPASLISFDGNLESFVKLLQKGWFQKLFSVLEQLIVKHLPWDIGKDNLRNRIRTTFANLEKRMESGESLFDGTSDSSNTVGSNSINTIQTGGGFFGGSSSSRSLYTKNDSVPPYTSNSYGSNSNNKNLIFDIEKNPQLWYALRPESILKIFQTEIKFRVQRILGESNRIELRLIDSFGNICSAKTAYPLVDRTNNSLLWRESSRPVGFSQQMMNGFPKIQGMTDLVDSDSCDSDEDESNANILNSELDSNDEDDEDTGSCMTSDLSNSIVGEKAAGLLLDPREVDARVLKAAAKNNKNKGNNNNNSKGGPSSEGAISQSQSMDQEKSNLLKSSSKTTSGAKTRSKSKKGGKKKKHSMGQKQHRVANRCCCFRCFV